jgi:hypothetical protein
LLDLDGEAFLEGEGAAQGAAEDGKQAERDRKGKDRRRRLVGTGIARAARGVQRSTVDVKRSLQPRGFALCKSGSYAC